MDERKKRAGKEGKRLNVRVNHFPLVTSLKKAYHYDVEVTTPFKRENRKSDKDLFFRAFEKLKKVYTQEFKRPFGVVFDGLKNAYSSHELFPSGSFEGKVELPEVEDLPEKLIELTIKLTLVGAVDVKSAIDSFCRQGSSSDTTVKGATQVINTIFGHMGHADNKLLTIGPTVFPKNQGRVIDIGRGRSLWHGTYLSFRPAWKPFLNVEMVSKPGYEEGSVLDFCSKVDYFNPQKMPPGQIKNISKELKGLKCRFERPDGHKRDYRANGLGPVATAPTAVQIERDGKTLEMSVQQYFMEEYKHKLEFPNYYTLHVGNPDRKIYLPIDMCKIKKQACPNNKKLTEDQTAQMIRFTAVTPEERKKRIEDGLRSMSNAFKQDPYAQEFGINVEGNMTTIPARMLDPPQLRYKGDKADVNENPSNGKWRMNKGAKFVDSKDLIRWAIMDLAGLQDQQIDTFVRGLTRSAWFCGLTIRPPSGKERCDLRRERDKAENKFRRLVTSMKDPQLVMVFSAGKDPMYSILKHVGDIDLKVPTQFVLKKNVFGKRGSPDPDAQTLHNICLKINSKLGGKNHDLSNTSRPEILKKPVMLIGADVTHPSPEAMGQKPSIAAMVASCDPLGLIYNCEVRLQWREGSDGKTKVEEVIKDTQGMIRLLLVKFYKATKQKPEKLIFYRDGVSEGQFLDVLNRELSAIRRACASLPGDYKPGITFLVAQKRHKTRLFPENPGKDGVGRMKNVPPGTVVDTDITSPTEESFFLASHEGIQVSPVALEYHVNSLVSSSSGHNEALSLPQAVG